MPDVLDERIRGGCHTMKNRDEAFDSKRKHNGGLKFKL